MTSPRTLMWEAKAAEGRADDLLAWVREHAVPSAQIYRSADERVVVIDPTDTDLPDPPADLLARPAHAWRFTPIPR
jgi:hypothetical protein